MIEFLLLALAASLSMLIIPVAWRLAPALGMIDLPDPRKVHAAPVPRVGGWGITVGSLVPLALFFPLDPLLQSFLVGSLILVVFGLWDDSRQVGHWTKFAGQFAATGVVVYYGGLYVSRLPFIEATLPPEIGQPLTMFAMVGAINAINHSDGLDGLAGGESLLSMMAIAVLGQLADSALVLGVAAAVIGGTFGFLRYNAHPARVFMGDAGSQFLGFALAFQTVYLTQVAHPAISAALPLLLLGLPIADILAVLYQRIRGGMSWFRASRNHVHHRLLDLGFSHFETVVAIYSIQVALVSAAVVLRYELDIVVAACYLVVIAGLFGTLLLAERRGWRRRAQSGTAPGAWPGWLARPGAVRILQVAPSLFVSAVVPAYLLACAAWVEVVPRDVGIAAGLLAAALAVRLLRPSAAESLFVRACAYVAASFAAYLWIWHAGRAEALVVASDVLMICLAVVIGIFARFQGDREFRTTPTDYLICFGLVALAAFESIDVNSGPTARFVAYLLVLFYGCEIIFASMPTGRRWLQWAVLASLAGMAGRSIA